MYIMILKNIYILNTYLLESFSNNIKDKNMRTKENLCDNIN